MVQGLSVSRLVRVSINLQPLAAARRSFGSLLVLGNSNVIDAVERIRAYTSLEDVATDFGTTAPEYKAAALYFGQTPQPRLLYIGRWLQATSAGFNRGGILTAAEQTLSNWTVITNGAFSIDVDGVTKDVTGLNFSAATNMNGVASIIDADSDFKGATCTWNGSRFVITSDTTGVNSEVSYASTEGTGTDISALLKLTAATNATLVNGFAAETPVVAAAELANISGLWYGLMFASTVMPTDSQALAVAEYIEALDLKRIYGVTATDTDVLDANVDDDIASLLKDALYKRTFTQYSANVNAVASFFGRAFSVNFAANRSTITMMYKVEPGVVAERLTETQAQTLKAKRCNVFVEYQNDTAIIQYGVMSGQAYFDEIHGLDWFQDSLQNACYNLLYQSKTKIPQTDAGMNQIVNTAASVCAEAVNNGLVAPGQWNADGFGQLERGNYLDSGYYIYAQPMALQPQATREERIAPPMQIALKLAGAIQEIDIIVDVNR